MQCLSVAMEQWFATNGAPQRTSQATRKDSRQTEIEPDNRGGAIPQDLPRGAVVAGGNPLLLGRGPFYKAKELKLRLGLPPVTPVKFIELDAVAARRFGERPGECGLARTAGADHDDALMGGYVGRHS